MPRLTLVRHAHASDASSGGGDFDRPLSAQGVAAARALAGELRALPVPSLLRVSPAVRTMRTAEEACLAAWPDLRADPVESLYLASVDQLLREVGGTPPLCTHLVIVGHNPGLSELWTLLGGERGFEGLTPAGWRSRELELDDWSAVAARPLRPA